MIIRTHCAARQPSIEIGGACGCAHSGFGRPMHGPSFALERLCRRRFLGKNTPAAADLLFVTTPSLFHRSTNTNLPLIYFDGRRRWNEATPHPSKHDTSSQSTHGGWNLFLLRCKTHITLPTEANSQRKRWFLCCIQISGRESICVSGNGQIRTERLFFGTKSKFEKVTISKTYYFSWTSRLIQKRYHCLRQHRFSEMQSVGKNFGLF